MHEIEQLLVTLKVDIVLIQEPATDGNEVYLLDRLTLRVIATAGWPRAAIVVVTIGVLAFVGSVPNTWLWPRSPWSISAYFQYPDALESVLDRVSGAMLMCANAINSQAR
jgi:hypothetical protein